jgi:hypothetical protein
MTKCFNFNWKLLVGLIISIGGLSLIFGFDYFKIITILIGAIVLSWQYKTRTNNRKAHTGLVIGLIAGFFPLSVALDGNTEAATSLAWIIIALFLVVSFIRLEPLQPAQAIFVSNFLLSFILVTGAWLTNTLSFRYLLWVMAGFIFPYFAIKIKKEWRRIVRQKKLITRTTKK